MSDNPERIWACMQGPMVGLFVSGGLTAGWPEYVRADLMTSSKDLLELAYQYQSDLRHPLTADSVERRLERIAAVLAKVGGA